MEKHRKGGLLKIYLRLFGGFPVLLLGTTGKLVNFAVTANR